MAERVLIVTPWYLPLLGGQERQSALLADAFARLGYEVDVLTEHADTTSPRSEQQGSIRVHRVRTTATRKPWTYPLVAAGMKWFLLRNRRRYRFAVVRTLTFPALLVGLLKALRVIRYPTLVTAETGGDADDVIALRGYPAFPVLRWVINQNDVLNGICADNIRHYRELGFPEAKLTRIYNGVDTAGYAAASFPERVRVFGFLGRLHHEKGIHELVEAFADVHAQHPDTRLVIAGSGDEYSALRAKAGDGVEFAGRIPYEQLGAFFERIDCLALPSYSEGLPLSVLEAAAHKRVIIATDVSDLRELFGDNVFICAKRDPADLARTMERVLEPPRLSYDEVVPRVGIAEVARQMARRLETQVP
jgi:glycosyltransferase involved in cell wall biosynthesis